MRSEDKELLASKRSLLPMSYGFTGALAANPNVMLVEGDDVSLFEYISPGVYEGHYLFSDVRGKNAIALAERMLHEMFTVHGAVVIKGLTPVNNKAARWISRQLGLTSYGVVSLPPGEFELFILHKKDFL